MFVLPPPPRYPSINAYNQAVANGQVPAIIETNNTISHPSGPEYQLVVGEGTYILKEDIQMATPPPHPSEAPIINPNPLATTPQPASSGTKVSLLSFSSRSSAPLLYRADTNKSKGSGPLESSIQEHPGEDRVSGDNVPGSSDGGGGTSFTGDSRPNVPMASAPAFGEGSIALQATGKDTKKKGGSKPRNNISKSNSSFISRCIINEGMGKRLQDRPADGYYAFANINRAFQWLDLSSPHKVDHLTKILFTKAHCLCHDVNQATKSPSHIDVIMGFSSGDIIWFEPIIQKYSRLNKNGIINSTPVSEIRWIPGSENLFLAAHMDGSLIVYDKEKDKDEVAFIPETNGDDTNGHFEKSNGNGEVAPRLHIDKSVHSRDQKSNPVAFWKLSNQRINAFSFSPNNRHLAVVSEDGTLRIIDYLKEQLLDLYQSYYGGFICVCWSPDGKYVLTGGQDDLVSIWSVAESTIVARCQGHQSWVTAVCFDPWRCDDRNYRFGSVGEDCRLLLWDFSVGMLHRPKAGSVRPRGSISSRLQRAETQNTTLSRLRSNSALSVDEDDEHHVEHPVEPRATTAMLPPVMSKVVDADPLCWLDFTEDSILTSSKTGHIRTWDRPKDGVNQSGAA